MEVHNIRIHILVTNKYSNVFVLNTLLRLQKKIMKAIPNKSRLVKLFANIPDINP